MKLSLVNNESEKSKKTTKTASKLKGRRPKFSALYINKKVFLRNQLRSSINNPKFSKTSIKHNLPKED